MSNKQTIVREFDPARVRPLPDQPRKRFRGIKELADSIFEVGQTTPGIVTLVDDDPAFDAQLVDGERRLRACTLAMMPFRAEVQPDAAADRIFEQSFAANFGRQNHDVVEIASGLDRLRAMGKTREQLARMAGKSLGWVDGHLSLLRLHTDVLDMLIPAEGEDAARLTYSLALLLVPLDHAAQRFLAPQVVSAAGLSMAAARRLVLREVGGTKGYGRRGARLRSVRAVRSIVSSTNERIGVYLDMPQKTLTGLIDQVPDKQKADFADQLRELSSNLEGLAEAFEQRVTTLAGSGS